MDWESLLVETESFVGRKHSILVTSHCYMVSITCTAVVYLHLFWFEFSCMSRCNYYRICDDVNWHEIKSVISASIDIINQSQTYKQWYSSSCWYRISPSWKWLSFSACNNRGPQQDNIDITPFLIKRFFRKIFCKCISIWKLANDILFLILNFLGIHCHYFLNNLFSIHFDVVDFFLNLSTISCAINIASRNVRQNLKILTLLCQLKHP